MENFGRGKILEWEKLAAISQIFLPIFTTKILQRRIIRILSN